jgi:hypothetical protein
MAQELRSLPRAAAPVAGEFTVDFDFVLRSASGSLDAELARDEASLRPVLAHALRFKLPTPTIVTIAAAVLPRLVLTRSTRVVALFRRAVTFAAAASVVAAALFSRSAPAARTGLAAETARLSRSTPIKVEFIDAVTPTDPTGAARILGNSRMAPRGGGP